MQWQQGVKHFNFKHVRNQTEERWEETADYSPNTDKIGGC